MSNALFRWLIAETFWQSYRRFFVVVFTAVLMVLFIIPATRNMPVIAKTIVSIFTAALSSFRFAQTYKDDRKKQIL